jgi:hypothetical protein
MQSKTRNNILHKRKLILNQIAKKGEPVKTFSFGSAVGISHSCYLLTSQTTMEKAPSSPSPITNQMITFSLSKKKLYIYLAFNYL